MGKFTSMISVRKSSWIEEGPPTRSEMMNEGCSEHHCGQRERIHLKNGESYLNRTATLVSGQEEEAGEEKPLMTWSRER